LVTHEDRVFDWVSRHDERSLMYQIPTRTTARGYRQWQPGPPLDQGSYGYCVGFGITGELNAAPIAAGQPTFDFAAGIFHLALKFDEIPGEADDTGTSVLAGAKAAQRMGLISEYRWCFGIDEVARGVYNHGPVVVGTPWLDSMMEPFYLEGHDAENQVVPHLPVLDISGSEVGGHCYLVTGFTRFGDTEWFTIRNSWGQTWGRDGDAMIRKADLAKLLRSTGEACILFDVPTSPGAPAKSKGGTLLQPSPSGMTLPQAGAYLPSRSGM
jgi:Papain family cysteine protease